MRSRLNQQRRRLAIRHSRRPEEWQRPEAIQLSSASLYALIDLVEDLAGIVDGEDMPGITIERHHIEMAYVTALGDIPLGLGGIGLA